MIRSICEELQQHIVCRIGISNTHRLEAILYFYGVLLVVFSVEIGFSSAIFARCLA